MEIDPSQAYRNVEIDPAESWRCPCCRRAMENREDGAREAERYRYLETCALLVGKQASENRDLRFEVGLLRRQLRDVAGWIRDVSARAGEEIRLADDRVVWHRSTEKA